MDGISKAEIDKLEAREIAKSAATLTLLDRQGNDMLVLKGLRHMKHAFIPGKLLFPGDRNDPADSRVKAADELHHSDSQNL